MTDRAVQWRLRRGMRELDLLLEAYFKSCWNQLDPQRKQAFREFLECEDDTLWDWLSGREAPAEEAFKPIVDDIRARIQG